VPLRSSPQGCQKSGGLLARVGRRLAVEELRAIRAGTPDRRATIGPARGPRPATASSGITADADLAGAECV